MNIMKSWKVCEENAEYRSGPAVMLSVSNMAQQKQADIVGSKTALEHGMVGREN